MKSFQNKNVLITGGSSGIGFALAEKLVAAGANVWILARRDSLLDEAIAKLQLKATSQDQKIKKIKADVANFSELKSTLGDVFSENLSPDLLINCAGIVHPGEFLAMKAEDFAADISVDYLGTVYTIKIIAPFMVKNRSGHIVNISSLAGLVPIYGYSAYSPAKSAIGMFSSILKTELTPYNIAVSVVYPSDTDTPQLAYDNAHKPDITKEITKGGGFQSPEFVADVILKGIQKKKFTIIPALIARILKPFAAIVGKVFHIFALSEVKKEKKVL
jgi:3-dehydrosphinganine reductase